MGYMNMYLNNFLWKIRYIKVNKNEFDSVKTNSFFCMLFMYKIEITWHH